MNANAALLPKYDALDRTLQAHGMPSTSSWWRKQLSRFLKSGRRRWVIRAGRRAGKSSLLCRLAVCVALWGSWVVPPGETAVIPFVSVNKDEASARLRTIAAILKILGVPFVQRSDEIELTDRPLVFRVYAASIDSVGFTSVLVCCDEMARWESRDTAANPAREVVASLAPTKATQPTAFDVFSSSPWGVDDHHHELFEQGDTDFQVTSFAPTWVANPSITEAQTHELEPDPAIHAREYGAEPGATVSAALDPADVASMFKAESAALHVQEVGGWEGAELRDVTMKQIVAQIAARAKAWGAAEVFGDQRENASLSSMFAEHGLYFRSYAWTAASKDTAVQLLRRAMREGQIASCTHDKFRRELLAVKARLSPSGITMYTTNGLDYASALITLAHAAADQQLSGRGFVAIDASSLRGDAFTYICGTGAIGEVPVVDLRIGVCRSERAGLGGARHW